ncbi:Crp/Fnr family transcriptional regulator [Chryseobacterium terrae]|uniref:Crp/Fnr family transcriptional regulator n=1 Tax=Chryseobacterium terrae TaxID=3163299 RepID=A0ABW8Y0N0_9FLAO
MLIPQELLNKYGAETETYPSSHIIFHEGDTPKYYYQIVEGRIKLNHYNDEGKELIFAILEKGLSVCELLLFIDKTYPVNAKTFGECTVIKLSKKSFEKLLDENPQTSRDINKFISERLYYKYIMLQNNSSLRPHVRVKGALDYYKSFSDKTDKFSYEIPLTRQQLASLTALRVETVIRTVKKLEKEGVLKIINRKIFV